MIGFDNTLIARWSCADHLDPHSARPAGQVAVRRLLLMMISPMILLRVFLWIPGDAFGIYVFACWAVYPGEMDA